MLFNRNTAGYIEGLISVAGNIVLFAIKFWAGTTSCSIALIADAWHTLSDSISSIMVIVGIRLSTREPDKRHPFGYGRWEHLISIFIGFLLAIFSYEFAKESIIKFQHQKSANFGTIAFGVTAVSIIIKEGLAQYAFFVGEKTKNLSIKADGWHHRTDALSSGVLLLGMFLQGFFWWIDSALGIIVSFMLLYVAYEITKEAVTKLLGEKPSEELIFAIATIVNDSSDDFLFPHHYHIHNYGNHSALTFHIKFQKGKSIDYCHEIATVIEKRILREMNMHATIHIEPLQANKH